MGWVELGFGQMKNVIGPVQRTFEFGEYTERTGSVYNYESTIGPRPSRVHRKAQYSAAERSNPRPKIPGPGSIAGKEREEGTSEDAAPPLTRSHERECLTRARTSERRRRSQIETSDGEGGFENRKPNTRRKYMRALKLASY